MTTDPMLDALAAISDKSPAIKRFCGIAAQRIIALEKPPPPVSTSRGGIGLQSLGVPLAAGVGRYDVAITDESNVAAALAQSPRAARTLVYMAAVDCNVDYDYGVTAAYARANGWLLKDAAGNELRNVGYPANYIGDVGADGYREAWANHTASVATLLGCDGVYADDVLGDTQVLLGGGYPAKYPDRAAWQDALAGFVAYVGAYLKARGLYFAVNASAFTPGDPNSNTAANDTAWWLKIGPSVNGLLREYWQQSPGSVDQVMTTDPAKGWLGQWGSWQTLPSVARSVGADFYALAYGNAVTVTYIRASHLLTWDGQSGAVIGASNAYQPGGGNLGQPLGPATVQGTTWARKFERGTVTLDALAGTARIAQA